MELTKMTSSEKAQAGLDKLKEAIVEFLEHHEHGPGNSDIARGLGIESDFGGDQENYLSWSVLGMLVNDDKVHYKTVNNRRRYFAGPSESKD